MALLTLPWICYLAVTLPYREVTVHYRAAWVGFDAGLVMALALTGFHAWRGSQRLAIAASATATMLLVDAWFDVMTTPGRDWYVSVLLATFVEVPLAMVCLWLALHTDELVERRIAYLARRAARAEARAARESARADAAERTGWRRPLQRGRR